MRKNIYLITVLIAIVIIYLYFFRKETFANASVGDLVQDRVNPLVANTNFGTNLGVAHVATPVAQASAIRAMSAAALNQPEQYHTIAGGITTQAFADYDMSLPIFDENSMLAMDNFCKSYDVSTNPFADKNSKFSQNCGVCFGSDGVPKGILVYQKDKDIADANKVARSYKYPRAMPSLGRSTCTGATTQTDDSAPPTLAINSEMYDEIKGRNYCKTHNTFANNCGQCTTNNSIWSYVKVDPGDTMKGLKLYLVGSGKVTVKINDQIIDVADTLLSSKPIISLGTNGIKEGYSISISVKQDGTTTVMIGGALEGTNPNGTKYLRELYDFIKDETSIGSSSNPTLNGLLVLSSYTRNPSILVKKIVKPTPPITDIKLLLRGIIPVTFIDTMQNQMAYYDCKNGPYITQQASATLLSVVDECAGQPSGGGYTAECKRKKILEAGCSSAGTWWTNPETITQATGLDAWLTSQKATARTVPAASMGCYGVDITTPCDSSPNSRECLAYTYASTQQ